jgi:RimK family alpha-L-glutamate ligase
MNICIIGPKDSKESLMIKSLAEEREYTCKRVYMPDIYFEVEGSIFKALHRKLDLMDFDVFIFRSVNKTMGEALVLAEYLHKNGKIIIDESLATERQLPLIQNYKLAQKNILQLDLYQTNSLKSGRDVLMEINHPILIKTNAGDDNSIMISEDWTDSYDHVRTDKQKSFLFQQYVKTNTYARVFVIGGKVIGGISKEIMEEEPKMNHSRWAKNRKLEVSHEVATIASSACEALGYEIASVDILEHDGKHYVLGVHRSPRFTIFQRVTGINFAEKILDYAVAKASR